MTPWVLIDTSYLAYRAMYSMGDLSYEGEPTAVLFGLLEQIRTICTDPHVNSNRIALFFDSRQSHRKKTFADYKRKRRQNLEPEKLQAISTMYAQVRILKQEVLPLMGIPSYRQIGLESDDLIAYAADLLSVGGQGVRGVMITSDGDLYQCITQQVHWYDPTRRLLYNPTTFLADKGVHPEMWGDVKTLAGCSGDGVPGIEGVGIKTAVDYLCGNLPETYKRRKAIDSEEGQAVIERNKGLVKLPHAKTKPFTLQEPKYSMKGFWKVCEKYGFTSYLQGTRKQNWSRFFSLGQGSGSPRLRKGRHGKKEVKGQRKGLIV